MTDKYWKHLTVSLKHGLAPFNILLKSHRNVSNQTMGYNVQANKCLEVHSASVVIVYLWIPFNKHHQILLLLFCPPGCNPKDYVWRWTFHFIVTPPVLGKKSVLCFCVAKAGMALHRCPYHVVVHFLCLWQPICSMVHHWGILMATTQMFHCPHLHPSLPCYHSYNHSTMVWCCGRAAMMPYMVPIIGQWHWGYDQLPTTYDQNGCRPPKTIGNHGHKKMLQSLIVVGA